MELLLAPSWVLTTEHSASSYGQPVLVNRHTGDAYGKHDIVQAYPSWDYTPADMAVTRMMKTAEMDADALAFCHRFLE